MIYEFNEFKLDIERRELWHGPKLCTVEPQVFDLLVYLLENREHVVSKDELINAVWNGRTVSDATLSTRINSLRKVLCDNGKDQAVIRTIPRHGFRFVTELVENKNLSALVDNKQEKQSVRFCITEDNVRIAYATSGSGPPIVKAPNWMHHLEFDWESPVWRHFLREMSEKNTLIRFDQRGNGLSDWNISEFLFDDVVSDLHTVVEQAGLDKFSLFGISQGCAYSIAYACLHPERVSHLILYGGFVRGPYKRGPEAKRKAEMLMQMFREGWGQNNPAFRQFFTTLFMPDATKEQMDWFNELQRICISPENAVKTREMIGNIEISDLASNISIPTLVLHCRDDAMVPFELGREMATLIPNAKFVALDGQNHLLLENEPAWSRFKEEVWGFLAEN